MSSQLQVAACLGSASSVVRSEKLKKNRVNGVRNVEVRSLSGQGPADTAEVMVSISSKRIVIRFFVTA